MKDRQHALTRDDLAPDFDFKETDQRSPAIQILRDVIETILLTFVMFLVIRLVVQDFQVDGSSMVPTLQNSQFVLVDKLTYVFGAPQRGDIVVFMPPAVTSSKDPYIKRIIGVPGDHIIVNAEGYVSVNGVALNETYVSLISNATYQPKDIIVEPGHYWVMGDNRPASSDSRFFGTVSRSEIIGKATLVYWPLSNFHLLPDAHPTFGHVPASGILMPAGTPVVLTTPARTSVAGLELVMLLPGGLGIACWSTQRRRPPIVMS